MRDAARALFPRLPLLPPIAHDGQNLPLGKLAGIDCYLASHIWLESAHTPIAGEIPINKEDPWASTVGKTAIVTGAGFAALKDGSAGSIGYGIATAFAKEGANLVITGRNEKKLDAAKEKLESAYGIEVLIAQADINASADNKAVAQGVVDEAMAKFGRIDFLVNNAQASASGVTLAATTPPSSSTSPSTPASTRPSTTCRRATRILRRRRVPS